MIKYFFILLIFPTLIQGQDLLIDEQTGKYTKQAVIEIENKSKQVLYKKAVEWITLNYNSANDVVQLDDKENGEIIGKGSFRIPLYSINPVINHTITILVKDGRYKYLISDLIYNDDQGNKSSFENCSYITKSAKKKLYPKIDEEIKSLIISLEKDMKTKPTDDW